MKLYTTDFISGKEIETIQMVKGSVVFSKNVVRDLFAGLKTPSKNHMSRQNNFAKKT